MILDHSPFSRFESQVQNYKHPSGFKKRLKILVELHEIDYTPSPQVPEHSDEITAYLGKFMGLKVSSKKNIAQNYREKHHDIDYILYRGLFK
ncbi:hypothetical protein G9A89_006296 [Geosiphon pyriformis]|nr:hypothetical protein G9A89_006296 [Geosiphon pyriformis]